MTKQQDSLNDIAKQAKRMQEQRQKKFRSPLLGLSAFGVVGWSVSVPTVAGIFLGRWLNEVAPQDFSWTLALMLGGLVLGIIYAWNWISDDRD